MNNNFNATLQKLLDPSYDGDIILIQNEQEYTFQKFCTLPTSDHIYFMLSPKDSIPNLEEGELVIFALEKTTFNVYMVVDRKELQYVHQEYLKLIQK